MVKKLNALLLLAAMFTVMIAACVHAEAASDLPYVDLTFYMMDTSIDDMDAFYEAFDVKEGDGMYLAPEARVSVW